MPKTILHVLEPLATGVLYTTSQICSLLSDEFDFHILHGVRPETPANYREYFPDRCTLLRWNVGRAIAPRKDWAAYRQLRRVVATLQPDVIHAHSSKAGALARLAFGRRGPPVLYSPEGFSFLRRDVSNRTRSLYRVLERALTRENALTIACGLAEYREAALLGGHVMLVPNMVDVPVAARSRAGTRPSPLRLAMVGGIRPQKNFPLFCAIAAHPALKDATFTWFGGGEIPDGLVVPSNVYVTGWMPRQELLAQLAECDAFVQTSLWEGLPIGVLEAMALGLPVLATPCEGNVELVLEGVNGHLCDGADVFAKHLSELQGRRHRLQEMGERSRQMILSTHTPERAAERWRSVYTNPRTHLLYN